MSKGTMCRPQEGYIPVCPAVPPLRAQLAQAHQGRCGGPNREARQEGPHPIPDRYCAPSLSTVHTLV